MKKGDFMEEMKNIDDKKLVELALDARKNAYTPYSKYNVGAALLCDDGKIYTGCNVESASYPCGICGERNAMSTAIADGHRKFKAIAIAGSSEQICTPCGMCRQFMYEFAPHLRVLCCSNNGKYIEKDLSDLLALGFGAESME